LGGRWLGLLYIAEFLVVTFYVQVPTRGWMDARLPIMLLAGGLMLFLSGSGKASVDGVMRNVRHNLPARAASRPISPNVLARADRVIKVK